LYRGVGEFGGHCRINLEIWNHWLPWLHHGIADDTV